MKFSFLSPDLHIHATTGQEIAELCKHFNLPIEKHVDDLIKGSMTYVASGAKHPWFELGAFAAAASVSFDFLKPYYDRLKTITGYDGPAFAVSDCRLRYGGRRSNNNLCHTHIVTDAFIDENGYHAHGFIRSQDWYGKTAAERAPVGFNGYLREHLGHTKSEPEYERLNNGLLRENPNYMKRHAPEPAAASEAVFEVIFDYWLDNHASKAQVELYDAAADCYATVVKSSSLAAGLMKTVREFHVDGYSRIVTFDQFKEMGNV